MTHISIIPHRTGLFGTELLLDGAGGPMRGVVAASDRDTLDTAVRELHALAGIEAGRSRARAVEDGAVVLVDATGLAADPALRWTDARQAHPSVRAALRALEA